MQLGERFHELMQQRQGAIQNAENLQKILGKKEEELSHHIAVKDELLVKNQKHEVCTITIAFNNRTLYKIVIPMLSQAPCDQK